VALAACSVAPGPESARVTREPAVSAATWAKVTADTRAAAAAAGREAAGYAGKVVGEWLALVRERTDAEFVPWLGTYWVQQWLALKLAWYRANAEGDPAAATARLGEYLRAQHRSRVLEPVAEEIDPARFVDQVTGRFVETLNAGIRAVQARHAVPQGRLERWLAGIPAIGVPPGASLLEIYRAEDPARLAAYRALAGALRDGGQERDGGPSQAVLDAVASRTAERLGASLALRGGTAAASLAGGLPGLIVGLGVTAWDSTRHEQERPAFEAGLRRDLNEALDGVERGLLEDPERGVLAAVAHIRSQLEAALPPALPQLVAPPARSLW
jgi:hypothetical protein